MPSWPRELFAVVVQDGAIVFVRWAYAADVDEAREEVLAELNDGQTIGYIARLPGEERDILAEAWAEFEANNE